MRMYVLICVTHHWRIQGAPPARAPQGSRFFCFDIQILRNVATSGVGAPLRGWRPPTGNPVLSDVLFSDWVLILTKHQLNRCVS